MRIGTETNSLVNNLYSRQTIGAPDPFVGQAATKLGWTDRTPATVVEVLRNKNGTVKCIAVTDDDYKVVSGSIQDGSAEYEYTTNLDGYKSIYKQNKKGQWINYYFDTDGKLVKGCGNLILGFREKYYDPCF